MFTFIIGLIIGGMIGVFTMALLIINKGEAEAESEDEPLEPDNIDDMIEFIRGNYTFDNQREMFIKECAEAIKASQKCKRTDMGIDAFNNFCEEVADVCIMVEQMKRYIGVKKINTIIAEKLNRQIERIHNDNT